MGKLLIIFKGNWADEMDIEGFTIVSKEHWEYMQLETRNTEFPIELGIGTNEEMTYEDPEEYLRHFKVHEISDQKVAWLQDIFGNYDFGHVPWLEGDAPDSFYEEHGYCPD